MTQWTKALAIGVMLVTVLNNEASGVPAKPQATSESPATGAPSGPPPEMMKALQAHIVSLTAACPPLPELSDDERAKLPIHVDAWGSDGDPDMLLVHGGVQGGLGGGPSTFDGQHGLAADGFHVRRVDRPGFGQSPSRGPDDMQADAVWIAAMLHQGTSLIGHSWGGAEALLAAAQNPAAVRALVLVEPALELLAASDPRYSGNSAVRQASMKRFGGWMTSKTPAEYGQAFRDSLGVTHSDASSSNATAEEHAASATRIGCAFLRARMAPVPVMQDAVLKVVAAGVPVLVISGGWSPTFDLVGEIVAERLHGHHVIVKSANHFVQQENATEFNRVVSEFLKATPSRR